MPENRNPRVVPQRMLDLCRNALRVSLSRNVELERRVTDLEEEVARLRRALSSR